MQTDHRGDESTAGLIGREVESSILDRLIAAVRTGESRVFVIHGAPGVGKSALLDRARSAAGDMWMLAAAGIENESELTFATLRQLCAPLLGRLKRLPAPQSAALETIFGMRAGRTPDRFLLGLAVLSLLADASAERPILCVIDDAQWMDQPSAQVLGFVARRLLAESVGLVFVGRQRSPELLGLPGLEVTGLPDTDAHALLNAVTPARLDPHIADRIVAETRGNPLALLEMPRGLTVTQLAGGLGLLSAGLPAGDLAERLPTSFAGLPAPTRLFLLLAAAEPVGDPVLLWRAGALLGITPATALADGTGELLTIDERVTFRHPLVRSAIYQAARPADRRAVHLALAEVTDERVAPDRRAWHLAGAAAGPDEAVAAGLEQSAGQARTRGGLGAAAAFLQRSVALTGDAGRRADRAVAAADVSLRAGDVDAAWRFAHVADHDARNEVQRARADLIGSRIAFSPPMLLAAARRLEGSDLYAAREAYLLAWGAAALRGTDRHELELISRGIGALRQPACSAGVLDLLLEAAALIGTGRSAAAVPLLRRTDLSAIHRPAWGWVADTLLAATWDEQLMTARYGRAVEAARRAGALAELPFSLASWGTMLAWTGDFTAAAEVAAEAAAGTPLASTVRVHLSALRGRADEAEPLITAALETGATATAHWSAAVLGNGLGRHAAALRSARLATREANPFVAAWVLPELVEAAARAGDDDTARAALRDLAAATEGCGTDWALGVLARSSALMSEGATAEHQYGEAIERLARTELRTESARAHLVFGEWLRRAGRRVEGRDQLRTAYEMFASIGMEAFGERARRELLATGESVRKRTAESSPTGDLTPQERQIALLVRDGFANPEVGARLFLSPRTVEWHLRKVFAKLSITSRRQLRDALPDEDCRTALE